MYKRLVMAFLLSAIVLRAAAQLTVRGIVTDSLSGQPVEFASVLLKEAGLWAVTAGDGRFVIRNAPRGQATLTVQCLGYARNTTLLYIKEDMKPVEVRLREDNLALDEVTVVALRKEDAATTSYTIDRTTLDNQQLLNLGEITTLLPGGKTMNATLMSDPRLALRADAGEKGNASFGTAIEVDGARLDNNAASDETMAASTRTLSAADIESVEVVAGVPSVEYGDLSNGVVKVKTRQGKSPFIVEGKLNQHTRQVAVSKGFALGTRKGMLNVSAEHARSFSDIASPYTAYQRNILSMRYSNVFLSESTPLTLSAGISANIGGYNSKADPDEEQDDYSKARDNMLRTNMELHWLPARKWLGDVLFRAAFSMADKLTEQYVSKSSASTQPLIHTTQEGYFIAQDYTEGLRDAIILGPTGYWHERGYNDSKPMSFAVKLKAATGVQEFSAFTHQLMLGAEYTGSHNNGRGTYYDDMRVAPTWREYRPDQLPWMHNAAIYAEDRLTMKTGKTATAELTAGLRNDMTHISRSEYSTVASLSPRINARYVFWRGRKEAWISSLSMHAGWGKSVKLPSFQVLFPRPAYRDLMAFASTSTQDNRSYYAYFTYPVEARYNPQLLWQYTNQADLGVEIDVKGTRITVSAFRNVTRRAYMPISTYTPFAYKYTPPSALDACTIAAENRSFSIDRQTGIVTVGDATGQQQPMQLDYLERRTYTVNNQFINASPVERRGVEWIVDFRQFKALRTALRLDGNYYEYKGLDEMLFPDIPHGVTSTMSGNRPYQYIGWYRGCNSTGTGYSANASVSNGSISRHTNLNATLTTHIPKIRLVVSLRMETTLMQYKRNLSELENATRGLVAKEATDYFGEPYDGSTRDTHIILYPEYFTTWENPGQMIPFAEKFLWARENDPTLFNDLAKLVIRTNYPYIMNPDKLSAYCSANISLTKEIGNHVSVSFYANNFFNNMSRVRSSQTGLRTSLFSSSYIPGYYYGLSLRLKI